MNRCFLFVCLFAAVLLSILGWFWLQQPPSNQELLANTAKALDYAEGWKSVGGPPWWTPNFLHGSSLAPHVTTLISMLALIVSSSFLGIFAGPKIAALVAIFIAALGIFAWARKLTGEDIIGAVSSVAFLLGSPLYLRLVHVEHMVFVSAFAVLPFVLLRLTILVEQPSRWNGLLFGAIFALLMFTYSKAAVLVLPLLIVYAMVLWLWRQRTWRVPGGALLAAFLAVFLLGLAPSLAAFREMKLATVFELSPFEGWQSVFSLKNDIVWFDRADFLTHGISPAFSAYSTFGGNYLGFVPLLLIGLVLFFRPAALYQSPIGFIFRLLVALVLMANWLGFGPVPILLGHLAFLKLAPTAPDIAVPLGWFVLVIQGWIIMRLIPPRTPGRLAIGIAAIVLYFIIPGFRLISWLPVFSDIRAPHDFFQIGGFFFTVVAAACAAYLAAPWIAKRSTKVAVAFGLCVLAILDVSPYLQKFFHGPMDAKVFRDFEEAQHFLATNSKPGWVSPLSGRYFYLLTPYYSKRGLTFEAFNSYLMARGVSYLQVASQASPKLLQNYMDAGGISFLLIDKTDPDTPAEIQERFRSQLKVAFENENFLVLENAKSMAPAYLAERFISGEAQREFVAQAALGLVPKGILILPDLPILSELRDEKLGIINNEGTAFDKPLEKDVSFPLTPLSLAEPRWKNYHKISLASVPKPGWAVVPEAYSPDWQAYSGSVRLPVTSSAGAFLAVRAITPGPIELIYSPPWWYNGFFFLAGGCWLALGLLALCLRLPLPAQRLRSYLNALPAFDRSPVPTTEFTREPIRRSVVVIPTYNESASLPKTLEKVFASHGAVEVLVVDDASPDGTADLVRQHPAFGHRLHLMSRAGKLGLGSAYREGFQWAFERGYDACLEMDADLSHDPADIPRLLQALDEGADAAIGSRYLGGVRVMNWPEHRLFLSTGASKFVRLVTGMPLTDATSGFKALRVSVLRTLDWTKFRTGGYGFQVELHHALWQAGARIVEVPIVFTERRDGETKMTIGIAIEAALHTIRLALEKK